LVLLITDTNRYISNYVVKNSTTTYDDSFSSTGNPIVGSTVCKSGIRTNFTCNSISSTSVNVTMTEAGYSTVCNAVETTTNVDTIAGGMFINQGDSGGTVYKSNGSISGNLYGVVAAFNSSHGYYTNINKVTTLFGSTFSIYTSSTVIH
jgi:hypothetical protein